ncbi:MAG: S9 family peptidase, partial [Oricola sp.]|nr:S9 family peptidase [Oricola sp.]
AAFSWDLETGRIKQLLRNEEDLYPAQSGLGRIVGRWDGTDYVFMPAYMGRGDDPDYDLLRVDLKKGYVRTHERGGHETIDWLVGEDGTVIAREDMDDEKDLYSIWLYEDGKARKIFEDETDIPNMSLLGVKADQSALIVSLTLKETDRAAIVALTPDGKFSEALFSRPDADVETVITTGNRVIYGVEYSGLYPSYEFFDPALSALMTSVEAHFPDAAVTVADWTSDFSHLVLYVRGGAAAPAYYVFDVEKRNMLHFGGAYKDLNDEDVGPAQTMMYKSRDGETLSGILTLPPSAELKAAHPTIIMPHGGPSAYDAVGFDWMAQYFASRGFAVIQPNFRGSSGFGRAFELAGHGEWGRGVMQHDVTDVVKAAITTGIADPDRICIVGASYGGYAALAGGAFTPELYKCVAAFAPVVDLR